MSERIRVYVSTSKSRMNYYFIGDEILCNDDEMVEPMRSVFDSHEEYKRGVVDNNGAIMVYDSGINN